MIEALQHLCHCAAQGFGKVSDMTSVIDLIAACALLARASGCFGSLAIRSKNGNASSL
jgi:hypothetical protein